ncbi:MAG: hypothetical protein AAF754_16290 [Pseudomonadota bacterium]
MRRRLGVAVIIAGAAAAAYVFSTAPQGAVTATNGRAIQMGDSGSMFMVTLDLQNDGAPVSINNVTSPAGAHASLMNPLEDSAIVVPGTDTVQLAMDGVHIMLHVPPGTFAKGTFHSLALGLSDGSEVLARVLHPDTSGGMAKMNHNMEDGIEVSPPPEIALMGRPQISANGFEIEITTQNFEFVLIDDSAPHVAGQGHAHIYLNGVKLGRLYEERFSIGALLPGEYVLTVVLNSNDHRPYMSDGAPTSLTYRFSI